jgi:hypothetical protein
VTIDRYRIATLCADREQLAAALAAGALTDEERVALARALRARLRFTDARRVAEGNP